MTAAAGLQGYRSLISGAGRLSPVPNFVQLSVFGLISLAFQKITLGICLSFFIIGGMDCTFLRLLVVLAIFFRRICADRDWVDCFVW